MTVVAIEDLYTMLDEQLEQTVRNRIDMKVVGESGLQVRIVGDNCLTSIGVRPNGGCDIDFLYASSELGEFRHFEFQSTKAALTSVVHEIYSAVERA
jgi:hypothetical protein